MAYIESSYVITLTNAGGTISLPVTEPYGEYDITGAATLLASYNITYSGTLSTDLKYVFNYDATMALNGNTLTVFGLSLDTAQALQKGVIYAKYNGSTWDTVFLPDFENSDIIETKHIIDEAVTLAKIEDVTSAQIIVGNGSNRPTAVAMSGDTTISNAGVVTIGNDKITTVKILDDNVTNAKLADMATLTVKANVTGGSANPTDVPIATLVGLSGWKTTGNAGLTAPTNFIGTTDTTPIIFKVNSDIVGQIGGDNISFGDDLPSITTGYDNISIGYSVFDDLTSGFDNIAIGNSSSQNTTTGQENVALGGDTLGTNTTGDCNTAVGTDALFSNTTGSYNTAVGNNARTIPATLNNTIALGANAVATADYQFAIPAATTTVEFGTAQLTSGAVIEKRTPVSANATATLTAAQVKAGYIKSTSAAATALTLPTGTLLGAELGATQGTIHKLYIDNTAGANTVTMVVAADGILSAGAVAGATTFGLLTIPSGATGVAEYTIMFTSATTYCFTRTA